MEISLPWKCPNIIQDLIILFEWCYLIKKNAFQIINGEKQIKEIYFTK